MTTFLPRADLRKRRCASSSTPKAGRSHWSVGYLVGFTGEAWIGLCRCSYEKSRQRSRRGRHIEEDGRGNLVETSYFNDGNHWGEYVLLLERAPCGNCSALERTWPAHASRHGRSPAARRRHAVARLRMPQSFHTLRRPRRGRQASSGSAHS